MPRSETARLIAELTLSDKLSPGLKKASGSLDRFDGKLDKVGRGLRNAGRNLSLVGVGAAVGIAAFARSGIESLAELEDATTSVEAAIKNAGIAGSVSAGQIATWANEIERDVQAAFDDKAIVAATETIIRYGKVTPQNIRPAMEVLTDLAARTGDVESASDLLAKVLADPTKAAGKLARQGIILTKEQQKTIKAMVEANDVAGAQEFILARLSETTRGAAAASAGPYRDSLNILKDVTEDAQRALGEGFLPIITKVSDLLGKELAKKSTIDGIRRFGQSLAGGLDSLIEIARNLPWGAIGDSLRIAGAGAKAVLDAFVSLPPWVQTAVLTGWGLNKLSGGLLGDVFTGLASGLIKGVLGMNAGVVNIKAGVVTGVGGGGIPGGLPGAAGGAGGVGTVAAGAGLGLVAAVTIVGISAAAVGLLGIGIGKVIDPTGVRTAQGKSDTASARGIPDANNKPLQDIRRITGKTAQDALQSLQTQRRSERGIDNVRQAAIRGAQDTQREVSRGATQTAASARAAGQTAAIAQSMAASRIISAIYANRPVISVQNVTRTYNRTTNYGPTSGSRQAPVLSTRTHQ